MISLNYTLMKNGLRELSDVDYQLRVWCGHEKNQQSSLVEAIEKIFDDSGYQGYVSEAGLAVGEALESQLALLSNMLSDLKLECFTEEEILSEAMNKVRLVATNILSAQWPDDQ